MDSIWSIKLKISITLIIIDLFLFSGMNLFSQEKKNEKEIDSISNLIEKHPLLVDKFSFATGIYRSNKGLLLGANGTVLNDIIDFNEKFDFNDNENTLFLYFNWKFTKKWSLSAEYFGVKNANSVSLDENISWEDNIYNARLGLKVGFDIRGYRVMFSRLISKGQKHDLGAGLGAHFLDIETFFEGEAFINNIETGEGDGVEFRKSVICLVAPLPNIEA